jgi:uncharacterized membrane protein (DUF4010 family)
MNEEQQAFYYLGAALALGLLIGVERGWKAREQAEGQRVAGVRTYGLIGLLGGATALLVYAPGLFYWWSSRHGKSGETARLSNPLEIKTAVSFGVLLALVMLLGRALQAWLGEAGVMLLATASGVADVDAITLSLARMSQDELAIRIAVTGIVIAGAVNSLVKAGMAAVIGGRQVGLRVAVPLVASAIAGLSLSWLLFW